MAGGESTGVDRVGEKYVRGRPQAPAVRLISTVEVTPTGVVIRAAVHPRHKGRLWPGVTGAVGSLHSVPLPGPERGNTRDRGHTLTCETGRPVPP